MKKLEPAVFCDSARAHQHCQLWDGHTGPCIYDRDEASQYWTDDLDEE